MKRVIIIVMFGIGLECGAAPHSSSSGTNDFSKLEPQYIAQTNSLLAVCALDRERGVLLRFRGIEIGRADLPVTGHPCVYEIGERPMADPNSWKMPPAYHHFYGRIPYRIDDVDPPFSSYRNKKGDLLLGVRLGWRFYAMKNLGQTATNAAIVDPRNIQAPLKVFEVNLPPHRTHDLDEASRAYTGQHH
jgi:hypothetical protein